jgi:FkbM family methyltransferase
MNQPSRDYDGYRPPALPIRLLANVYLAVFGRKAFYRWNEILLTLAVRGLCVSDPMERTIGPGERTFLRRLAKRPSPVVFDVGANVGEYSTLLVRNCSAARVWAFEPHPTTFKHLQSEAKKSGFSALNLGLSDRPGRATLFDYASIGGDGSPHASLHRQVIADLHHSDVATIDVEVTTVDEQIESLGIERLSLLKVDAEGHELRILQGAVKSITSRAIDVVQFEFNVTNVISRVFFKDFYETLPGYSFYRMVVDGLAPMGPYRARTHELFSLHNVIAIRDGLDYSALLI